MDTPNVQRVTQQRSRLAQALLILVLIAFAGLLVTQGRAAILFVQHGWSIVSFPYPVDYGEGPLLDQSIRLAHGENIYRSDLSQPPFTISNYPPLFVLAQTPFVWLVGPSFFPGRAISLLSILATAVLIALTIHAITHDWIGALAGGLTLLAIPYILHWGPLNRIDSFALGLSWAGLFVIARWPKQRWSLITAALLLTASIFTRQSYALAAPLAAFAWLLRGSLRRALALAGIIAGVSLVLFGALNLLTGGGFYFNVVTANVNPFYWGQVDDKIKELREHMPYLLWSSGLFLLLAVWTRTRSWWLVGPYLVGGALTALTIGKSGSNVNYLYELSAALSVTAGAIVAWPRAVWTWLRVPLILLLAWQITILIPWTEQDYYPRFTEKITRRTEIEQLMDLIHSANGPVLADEYMGLLPLDHRPILIQPFEIKQLADAGRWDEQPFIDAINAHQFAMITLYHTPDGYALYRDRWTAPMLSAIDLNYDLVERVADTFIYRPKQPIDINSLLNPPKP